MNGFRKLQERLTAEGWYVGWNHYCCQTCAWMDVPDYFDDGTEVELSKVLFNHSQDCEVWDDDGEECPHCEGEGYSDDGEDCEHCNGTGILYKEIDTADYDTSQPGFVCNTPEQQDESTFCFDGSDEGVKNLKAILPIIEECGCEWFWSESGEERIEIAWKLK